MEREEVIIEFEKIFISLNATQQINILNELKAKALKCYEEKLSILKEQAAELAEQIEIINQ